VKQAEKTAEAETFKAIALERLAKQKLAAATVEKAKWTFEQPLFPDWVTARSPRRVTQWRISAKSILAWKSSYLVGSQAPGEPAVPRTLDRITVDPTIMNGQPCFRGMRRTVRRVLEAAALYPDRNELKSEYPELSDEDIAQALDFAARNLDDQIFPLEAA
jgi:uncharacterized protein (DUF433 family)